MLTRLSVPLLLSTLTVLASAAGAQWAVPKTVPGVNAPNVIDMSPCLSHDGLTLYFGSARPGGSGGFDLYQARRNSVYGSFSAPVPVKGVNTPRTETQPTLLGLRFDHAFLTPGSNSFDFASKSVPLTLTK